jgi:hypothetical protein
MLIVAVTLAGRNDPQGAIRADVCIATPDNVPLSITTVRRALGDCIVAITQQTGSQSTESYPLIRRSRRCIPRLDDEMDSLLPL